jgi:hypothetical protein
MQNEKILIESAVLSQTQVIVESKTFVSVGVEIGLE